MVVPDTLGTQGSATPVFPGLHVGKKEHVPQSALAQLSELVVPVFETKKALDHSSHSLMPPVVQSAALLLNPL